MQQKYNNKLDDDLTEATFCPNNFLPNLYHHPNRPAYTTTTGWTYHPYTND